jgi:hypothetical protein
MMRVRIFVFVIYSPFFDDSERVGESRCCDFILYSSYFLLILFLFLAYGLDQYSSHPHYELFTQEVDLFAIFTLESLSRGV